MAFSPKLGRTVRAFRPRRIRAMGPARGGPQQLHVLWHPCRSGVDDDGRSTTSHLQSTAAVAPQPRRTDSTRVLGSPFRCAECRRDSAALLRARAAAAELTGTNSTSQPIKNAVTTLLRCCKHRLRSNSFASQPLETRVVAGFWPAGRRRQWRSDNFGLTTVTTLLRSTPGKAAGMSRPAQAIGSSEIIARKPTIRAWGASDRSTAGRASELRMVLL